MGFPRQEYWSGLPFPLPDRWSSLCRDLTCVSCIGRQVLYHWATTSYSVGLKNRTEQNRNLNFRIVTFPPLFSEVLLQRLTSCCVLGEQKSLCSCFLVKVAQLCPALYDPMGYIGHGILQARILGWVAFPFSRGSSQPRNWTGVSCIAGRFFTNWASCFLGVM